MFVHFRSILAHSQLSELSLTDSRLNTVFRILLFQKFISREHFNKVAFYQLNIPNQSSYKSWPLAPSVQA